jgi:hypothetical protein
MDRPKARQGRGSRGRKESGSTDQDLTNAYKYIRMYIGFLVKIGEGV